MVTPIRSVLIANRGEIAVRVMRTAKARGLRTIAVYSDADRGAYHVRCADEAHRIGGAAPAESYLNIERVIDAAKRSGADAVHPGYGFLSERAAFAKACEAAGLVFIAPPAAAIAAMGDKAEAKRRMIAAGVPTIPGYQDEDQSDARLASEAKGIGFPLMVKASAGGGGRGMRIVDEARELGEAIASARREAQSAFGDGRLILERAIPGARHVEVQVMADSHGNVVHLGERDCSLQRRRQKVIEEAPSPVISLEMRERMGAAAVEAARAVAYRSAGTVEFLYDPKSQAFFFLEMNTRIQVEHPVTEMVTATDIVALQFDIAEGKPLALRQEDVRFEGWAIEARLYAEAPAEGFLPQSGTLLLCRFPEGPGIRVDAGIEEGDEVTTFYDPMLAKIIAFGRTREDARARLVGALKETSLLGVVNNRDFLIALLEDEAFAAGKADTAYIEENLQRLAPRAAPGPREIALAAAAFVEAPFGALLSGWNSRGSAAFPVKLDVGGGLNDAAVTVDGAKVTAAHGGETATVEILEKTADGIRYLHDGVLRRARYARHGGVVDLDDAGRAARYVDITLAPAQGGGAAADEVKAPMAGVVTSIGVEAGARVAKGDILATIEAMKMEHRLAAPRDGVVAEIRAKAGDQVAIRAVIARLDKVSEA